jgi:two-component system cell cycle sensor histidine kinase/response regulator CckA
MRDSHEKLKALFDRNLHCIYVHDFEGNFLDANDASLKLLGYKREDIPSINFATLIGDDQLPKALEALEEIRQNGLLKNFIEFKLQRNDGSNVWVETDSSCLYRNGDPIAILGVARDVTNRKQTMRALKQSEEKYRLLVENANDAIFIVQDNQVKFPNKMGKEMGRYLGLELEKIPFANYIHPDDRDMVIDRHFRRLKGEKLPNTYSFRIVGKDEQLIWAELNTVSINWEDKPATLNFLRDVTSQKEMENQFYQAQKMKAIGTLAGGVAHDFNNLLMCIQGNASIMLTEVSKSHHHYELVSNIIKSVESAAELTNHLLGFSRKGKYKSTPSNLNDLMVNSSKIFARTRKEMTIHRKLQEKIWAVEVDSAQIEQSLLNLYINAAEAMPNGGDLYLETENILLEKNTLEKSSLKPGKYVKISVADVGTGIDEKDLQRIFEPFFSTKKFGRGNGLGLASVYGIVKNHGGIINVDSKINESTTFTIYLPASKNSFSQGKTEETLEKEKRAFTGLVEKNLTVLVVDDEEKILYAISEMLKRVGFKLFTATSGQIAIELYQKNMGTIDIVILDMIMPDMDGGETYLKLKNINQNVKVLLSSGYSLQGQAQDTLKLGGVGFIQKPFSEKELLQEICVIVGQEN